MFFDADGEETVQADSMFPIFDAPDTPLYQQRWQTTLPGSFFDDLEAQPPAVRSYERLCDGYYGPIPMERRDMWHNHVNYYLNCLIDVDRHIGAVLDALEASGQADDTVVIFTADHGEMAGAHHLRQKGSVAFKETVNVPLMIVDPRRPGGGRTDAVGSHLDLVPTILAYAGLSEAERRQRYPFLKGHDLSGIVEDPASAGPRGTSGTPARAPLTYDMIATIDAQWFARNAPKMMDAPQPRPAWSSSAAWNRSRECWMRSARPTLRNGSCSAASSTVATNWSATLVWAATTCRSPSSSCWPTMMWLSTIRAWILKR